VQAPFFEEKNMKKLLTLLAAISLTGCANIADAGALLDVTVINRSSGERMATYRHGGRLYVAGTPGDRYAVELSNRSGGRVLAVLSVDGVNAVTGQTAAPRQSGYVLDAGSRAEISGWRKSMEDVAAFYFTALPDSYAARTDRPDHVGVIGVAVFRERVEPRVEEQPPALAKSETLGAARAAPAAPAAAQESKSDALADRLGTGHGERIAESTRYTDFRRDSTRPVETITIYYDSYRNLVARGVVPSPARLPQPFPGGFVPDPRG
jgi:hypothetical protein